MRFILLNLLVLSFSFAANAQNAPVAAPTATPGDDLLLNEQAKTPANNIMDPLQSQANTPATVSPQPTQVQPGNPAPLVNNQAGPSITLPDAIVPSTAQQASPANNPAAAVPVGNNTQANQATVAPANLIQPAGSEPVNATIQNVDSSSIYIPYDATKTSKLNSIIPSLLYSPEQIDLFTASAKNYLKSGAIPNTTTDGTAVVTDAGGDNPPPEVPPILSYAFNTILYPEDGIWTLWLNGNRIRKDEDQPPLGMEFAEIDKYEMVGMIKLTHPIDFYAPDYKSVLVEHNNGSTAVKEHNHYYDYASKNGALKYSSYDNVVEFRLGIHQTFILNKMKIYEGVNPIVPGITYGGFAAPAAASKASLEDVTVVGADGQPVPAAQYNEKDLDKILSPNEKSNAVSAPGQAAPVNTVPTSGSPAPVAAAPAPAMQVIPGNTTPAK